MRRLRYLPCGRVRNASPVHTMYRLLPLHSFSISSASVITPDTAAGSIRFSSPINPSSTSPSLITTLTSAVRLPFFLPTSLYAAIASRIRIAARTASSALLNIALSPLYRKLYAVPLNSPIIGIICSNTPFTLSKISCDSIMLPVSDIVNLSRSTAILRFECRDLSTRSIWVSPRFFRKLSGTNL